MFELLTLEGIEISVVEADVAVHAAIERGWRYTPHQWYQIELAPQDHRKTGQDDS